MKIKNSLIGVTNTNSCHQQFYADRQRTLPKSSVGEYPRNGVLSSIGEDSLQTVEALLRPVHCNNPFDMFAALKSGAKCVEIPDDVFQELIEDAEKGGHLDNPGDSGQNGDIIIDRNTSIGLPPYVDGT